MRAGFTTIEGMIAITLFALAALGAAGAMARSATILALADRETVAARATEQVAEQIRASLGAAGDRCSAMPPGSSLTGQAGVVWSSTPVPGGIELRVMTTYQGFRRARSDTLWFFLPCR